MCDMPELAAGSDPRPSLRGREATVEEDERPTHERLFIEASLTPLAAL